MPYFAAFGSFCPECNDRIFLGGTAGGDDACDQRQTHADDMMPVSAWITRLIGMHSR